MTVELVFRAITTEPELIPRLLVADKFATDLEDQRAPQGHIDRALASKDLGDGG